MTIGTPTMTETNGRFVSDTTWDSTWKCNACQGFVFQLLLNCSELQSFVKRNKEGELPQYNWLADHADWIGVPQGLAPKCHKGDVILTSVSIYSWLLRLHRLNVCQAISRKAVPFDVVLYKLTEYCAISSGAASFDSTLNCFARLCAVLCSATPSFPVSIVIMLCHFM